jgi:hypothetical protein
MRFTKIHIALIPTSPGNPVPAGNADHHKIAAGIAPSRMQYRIVAFAAFLQHLNSFA